MNFKSLLLAKHRLRKVGAISAKIKARTVNFQSLEYNFIFSKPLLATSEENKDINSILWKLRRRVAVISKND